MRTQDNPPTRRRFLHQILSTAATTGLVTLPIALDGQSNHGRLMAIEPMDRPKPGQLRLSMAAYSLRDL
ncbi:MAG: hypothetical protein MUF23_13310, partial [Pirellula sp.]|nr:hypothetical protein [Pirellula sp.]